MKAMSFSIQERMTGVPQLLAARVAHDDAVERGRFAGFRVAVVGAHGVDLDVRALRVDELLVQKGAVAPHAVLLGVVLGRLVADLPEEALAAAARAHGVVDVDVVVVRVDGLLHEGLLHLDAVDDDVVVVLL